MRKYHRDIQFGELVKHDDIWRGLALGKFFVGLGSYNPLAFFQAQIVGTRLVTGVASGARLNIC